MKSATALEAGSRERFDLERDVAAGAGQPEQIGPRKSGRGFRASGTTSKSKPIPRRSVKRSTARKSTFNSRRDAWRRFRWRNCSSISGQAQQQVHRLHHQPELTDTVGPIDGFMLEYTLERVDVSDDPNHVGSYPQLQQCTFLPMSADLGEMGDERWGRNRNSARRSTDATRAAPRSRSGRMTTALCCFARCARNCTGWASRSPAAPCRKATPSAPARTAASRRLNRVSINCFSRREKVASR